LQEEEEGAFVEVGGEEVHVNENHERRDPAEEDFPEGEENFTIRTWFCV
jgi:hypothetical protein